MSRPTPLERAEHMVRFARGSSAALYLINQPWPLPAAERYDAAQRLDRLDFLPEPQQDLELPRS